MFVLSSCFYDCMTHVPAGFPAVYCSFLVAFSAAGPSLWIASNSIWGHSLCILESWMKRALRNITSQGVYTHIHV